MKTWGIIATVLLFTAIGFGGWLYVQNNDLKSQKSKAEASLSATTTKQTQTEAKMASSTKKIGLVSTIMAGINGPEDSLALYDVIKTLNDETLTADWKAFNNSKPGDDSGNKMLADLLSSATKDLK